MSGWDVDGLHMFVNPAAPISSTFASERVTSQQVTESAPGDPVPLVPGPQQLARRARVPGWAARAQTVWHRHRDHQGELFLDGCGRSEARECARCGERGRGCAVGGGGGPLKTHPPAAQLFFFLIPTHTHTAHTHTRTHRSPSPSPSSASPYPLPSTASCPSSSSWASPSCPSS